MVTIQDAYKNILAQDTGDGTPVSGVLETRIPCVIYIDYNKGDEEKLVITFDAYFRLLDDFYPIMFEDSAETVTPIRKELSESGKYRLLVTMAENETALRVNATLINNSGTAGDVIITIVPISPSI